MTNEADTVQVNNTNSIVTYENPIQGIKIQYPSDWEKQEEEGARAMATTTLVNFLSLPRSINDQFPETLNVGVEDLPT